ncbi:MAG: 1-deoxy-D-xylulose-5-phosphate reductoisomerase [Planctomycetes bacterium]|nr:1-deoxy-D-xylulose-5-phosphate reductoisomerase [Planctomycetota bacterium]MBU1518495.1 1-deoxy-D-xylulose-5-phosphate reductoisomerase [Planctomycetota bacterium]MBU2457975.1 1-deoxy-D-xylulose-5-phosphate reductoisomerase [Planctomycetota bacterium]MBU2597462.1 1-deoxy-D-xylulose-5-phosphate reductoisomerase [Planctomycetota bacterium]
MTKRIAILGSTGSIGTNALRVIEALGADYKVAALTAHNNVELLAEQVKKFKPKVAAVTNPKKLDAFKKLLGETETEIHSGNEGLEAAASDRDVDIVIAAVVGAAGLEAILAAAKAGKILAIANKEPLVIAGALLTKIAKETGAKILPVDSEHSAVFQAMQAGDAKEVNRIILTASGGPFRGATKEQIKNATIEQTLAHPTWNMGKKITVDSATMMNKALEIIEAKWLFDMPVEKIEVLVHPESIIHSMVEFVDGSVIAQMSGPDMCLPIQYALTFPHRVKGITKHLRLEEIGSLTFEKPDMEVFKALKMGYEVARTGGTAAAVFNAANEAAVKEFLEGKIKFVNIVEIIEYCLNKHKVKTDATLNDLLSADDWARNEVKEWLNRVR